jgi:glyoxylase-like metal-dependent hydrolase (beta-lactamase superfamily II)
MDDIDAVITSHLHLDHAGGLEFFDGSDIPIYVHERELKYAWFSVSTPPGVGNIGYVRDDFDYDLQWQPLYRDRVHLFEDVELVHVPGHSPGLLSAVVHLDEHGTVVLAGDSVHLAESYERETPPGGGLLENKDHWLESLRLVKHLKRVHDADVLYGHETGQLENYGEGWV